MAEEGDECEVGEAIEEVKIGGKSERRKLGCKRFAICKVAPSSGEVRHRLNSVRDARANMFL